MQLTALFVALVPLLPARLEAHLQEKKPAQTASTQEPKPETLAAERKELAALRLLVVAERKFAEAKERLIKLEQTLQTSTAVDATTLRRDVRALLDEVRRALGEKLASPSERIDEVARRAIAENDWAFIAQIGSAAVPALREAVLATPDFLPSTFDDDPFSQLLKIDPVAASGLCETLATEQGYFWRRRVLRALQKTSGFERESLWSADGSTNAVPGLVQQLERLLAEPDTRLEALGLVNPLLVHGTVPGGVRQALREAMGSSDSKLRGAAWQVGGFPLMRDLYLEAARSPDADVRMRAASRLRGMRYCGADFLALARDPSWAVRAEVAAGLGNLGWPEYDEVAYDAVQRLVLDEDSKVRTQALRLLERLPYEDKVLSQTENASRRVHLRPLPPEFLARMVASEDAEVRGASIEVLAREPSSVALPLYERLVAEQDAGRALKAFEYSTAFWFEDALGCLRVAEVALANSLPERRKVLQMLQSTLSGQLESPTTRVVALEWALRNLDDDQLGYTRLSSRLAGTLPAGLLRSYCERHFVTLAFDLRDLLKSSDLKLDAEQVAALRELSLDLGQPVGLRLLALRRVLAAGPADETLLASLPALFGDHGWAEVREDRVNWQDVLFEVLQLAPANLVNGCLLALLAVPNLSPERLGTPLRELESSLSGADAVLEALLKTHFGAETRERQQLADLALRTMGNAPTLARREWLERGARDERHAHAALASIGLLRDPAYLPLLDELVRSGNVVLAARALQGYLSNEAGELLLVAATKLSGEARDQALAHLTKIREYQDARAEWATRKTSRETRAAVVAELVAKLDAKSEEVKVEAIRALATWEAVEAMPRLIELTQSGSKGVAAAARAALERLNAPKETTGG